MACLTSVAFVLPIAKKMHETIDYGTKGMSWVDDADCVIKFTVDFYHATGKFTFLYVDNEKRYIRKGESMKADKKEWCAACKSRTEFNFLSYE